MAGSGVGKSSLLSMIARGTDAEISVIALIGERGREVREFLENDLGPEGLARSIVIVATSDEPPVVRLRAAFVATRIAEWFRDSGRHVVLMMDSLTRVALAQREIGLSAGEPPATRGFPPSVFALLPRLLERAGTSPEGSITGLYTVLVEGDDLQDPIGDAARSILDGHIVLSRELATSAHFPSIDVLESISRVASAIVDPAGKQDANRLRRLLAAYRVGPRAGRDRRVRPRRRRRRRRRARAAPGHQRVPAPGHGRHDRRRRHLGRPARAGGRVKRPGSNLRGLVRLRSVRERDSRIGLAAALTEERAAADLIAELERQMAAVAADGTTDVAAFQARQHHIEALGEALISARGTLAIRPVPDPDGPQPLDRGPQPARRRRVPRRPPGRRRAPGAPPAREPRAGRDRHRPLASSPE